MALRAELHHCPFSVNQSLFLLKVPGMRGGGCPKAYDIITCAEKHKFSTSVSVLSGRIFSAAAVGQVDVMLEEQIVVWLLREIRDY